MFSLKSIVLIAAAFAIGAECSGVPAVAAAPLVAPAQVGYAHAVPQNVLPYASQVSVVNRAINPYFAGPAPLAAPIGVPAVAPIAARYAAPLAAPAPVLPAPYAAAPYAFSAPFAAPTAYAAPFPYAATAPAAYAAPYPYAAAAPLVRAPFGVGPAFVR